MTLFMIIGDIFNIQRSVIRRKSADYCIAIN